MPRCHSLQAVTEWIFHKSLRLLPWITLQPRIFSGWWDLETVWQWCVLRQYFICMYTMDECYRCLKCGYLRIYKCSNSIVSKCWAITRVTEHAASHEHHRPDLDVRHSFHLDNYYTNWPKGSLKFSSSLVVVEDIILVLSICMWSKFIIKRSS